MTSWRDLAQQNVYFIGIALPVDCSRLISDLQWHLSSDSPHALKPIVPHITLLHPPSVAGIMPIELLPRVHDIATRYLPITVQLDRIGFFGNRVCYIEAESFKLHSLHARLVRLLPPEAQAAHYKRPYLPHVTLVQVYDPSSLDKLALQERIVESLPLPIRLTIESVAYFRRIVPRMYESKVIV